MIKICIIGGGASGISLLAQLVDKFIKENTHKEDVQIFLYEKNDHVGPGLAYSTPDLAHIINLDAKIMSPIMGQPDHFLKWAQENKKRWSAIYPEINITNFSYPPRILFGMYLKELASTTLEYAKKNNIYVEFRKAEVLAVRRPEGLNNNYFYIDTEQPDALRADQVILCIGHLPSTEYMQLKPHARKGYFHSPWPTTQFKEVPLKTNVCIIGTRLTAIDVALSLIEQGHEGKITMVSRNGLLPAIIGPTTQFTRSFITLDAVNRLTADSTQPLRLSDILGLFLEELKAAGNIDKITDAHFNQILHPHSNPKKWLEKEIAAAKSNTPRPWQSLLASLYPIVTQIWHALGDKDKKEFLTHYYSIWMTYLAAFPLQNAEKLLQHISSGRIEILGGLKEIVFDNSSDQFNVYLVNNKKPIPFNCVINATGAGHDITKADSPLLKNLLDAKLISPHPLGGINVNFKKLCVLTAENKKIENLFVVGDATWGVCMATADLGQIGREAQRLVNTLYGSLFKTVKKQSLPDMTEMPELVNQIKHLLFCLKPNFTIPKEDHSQNTAQKKRKDMPTEIVPSSNILRSVSSPQMFTPVSSAINTNGSSSLESQHLSISPVNNTELPSSSCPSSALTTTAQSSPTDSNSSSYKEAHSTFEDEELFSDVRHLSASKKL